MIEFIKGSGGGGGGKGGGGGGSARVAVEAPDSLRSIEYAKVIDLISEGEIGGLVDGLKSIYLDETPIKNADDSLNFTGIVYASTNGTQDQTSIPGFTGSYAETAVSTEIKQLALGGGSGSVTRNIINSNLDAVRVTIGIPQLTSQNTTNGDINGTSVDLSIEVSTDNGASYNLMPISIEDVGSVLSTTADVTTCSKKSSYFNLVVNWNGIQNSAGSWYYDFWGNAIVYPSTTNPIQQHETTLQYRIVGNTTWTSFASVIFTGKTKLVTSQSSSTNIFGYQNQTNTVYTNVYPTGTKTFILNLPEDFYEFRLLDTKTSGIVTIDLTKSVARVAKYYDTISGKTISKYQRSYRVPVPQGFDNYLVRVNRLTADSTSSSLINKTWWDSYTEITDDKLSYPNSALIAISVDASQFNRIPNRAYEIYGIKVKIPSNYNPYTKEYTGIWDGTFVTDWTDNPAWIFYDLVTNTRYGLGNYLSTSMLDKWSLYSIGQYCDEFVPDGISPSGYEPRFTCNLYLQTQEDAFRVVNNLASIFRAITYWNNSTLMVSQDRPSDSVALFTPANVIEGMFTYQGSSLKARHTVALVTWNDPADSYKTKTEYVEDLESISKYGILETQLAAMGCTSRGQAHRLGKWLLYTERYETETITFKTGLDGILVYPGAIIQTYDAFRTGKRLGGRIVSATTNVIDLDQSIVLEAGKNYKLSCTLADGTIEVKSIINTANTTSSLRTSTDFSEVPKGIWILAEWVTLTADSIAFETLVLDTWRVVSITESDVGELEIIAVEHHPEKFLEIERNIDFQTIGTVPLVNSLLTPTNLSITETLYISAVNSIGIKLHLNWISTATNYKVFYKPINGNWTELLANTTNIDIYGDIIEGDYSFKVIGVNSIGLESPASEELIYTVVGKTAPPTDITYINAYANAYGVYLDWEPCTEVDFSHYEIREGTIWETAALIASNIKESYYQVDFPSVGVHNYLVKAVDTTGNYSLNA